MTRALLERLEKKLHLTTSQKPVQIAIVWKKDGKYYNTDKLARLTTEWIKPIDWRDYKDILVILRDWDYKDYAEKQLQN